jgi:hypothetical protein
MKKIFLVALIITLNISVYPQQPQDSIFVIIDGETVHIWNTGALENCASKFRMDVGFSADTVFVVEVDTTDIYVPCMCYYNLCASITGLQSGFYYVKVLRKLPLIFPDTSLYIGSTSFNYEGSSAAFTTSSYQSDCDPITPVEENSIIPQKFELLQNYPNPFNPSTVIGYQLPVSGEVTLEVFDILGNEVATLVDDYKPAGKYEVEFSTNSHSGNDRNLPAGRQGLTSGIYFYQLLVSALQSKDGKSGEYISTKKMVLLK